MTNRQLARLHSTLRVRLRLRQQDVAAAAGLNRGRVTKLEAGQIDELRVREVRSCFEALGARLDLVAGNRGAQLDRLLDELHAAILGAVVAILRSDGWEVRIEVSFAIGGERGSIDVVAWKAEERALLVVEVKSELPGIDPLLRPLDVKVPRWSDRARIRMAATYRVADRCPAGGQHVPAPSAAPRPGIG